MKIIKGVAIVVILILAFIFITPVFLSGSFKVQREKVINAKPEVVYSQVNGFKKWEPWSPWLQADKSIKNTYTGPDEGVGNKVNWTSNDGDGSMEIIEVVPNQFIRTRLAFNDFTPFEGHFTFEPVEGGTKMVWMDTGNVGYIGRWMTVFADKMMGPDFEKGLTNLKQYVESLPEPTPTAVDTTIKAAPLH